MAKLPFRLPATEGWNAMRVMSFVLIATCATLFLGASIISYAADDCGGIKNGTLTRSKLWAHANRNTPSSSQGITVTAVDWVDYDTSDPESCTTCDYNDWSPSSTEWTPLGGTSPGICDPTTGAYTVWKPAQYGDSYKVRAKFKDAAAYNDDSDVTSEIDVKAFEVKVIMNIQENDANMGFGSTTKTMWEYDSSAAVHDARGGITANHLKWSGNMTNGDTQIPANVHIDYQYQAVPNSADLYGGQISAALATSTTGNLHVDVEDADIYDGPVTITVGASLSVNGVGFSISTPVTFGDDCAEGVAVAAWGYSCTDGLGASRNPENNNLCKKSCDEADTVYSAVCRDLKLSSIPPASWFENHPYDQGMSHTAAQTIPKPHGGQVQAQWDAYVRAKTAGDASGARAAAAVENWQIQARINSVSFSP